MAERPSGSYANRDLAGHCVRSEAWRTVQRRLFTGIRPVAASAETVKKTSWAVLTPGKGSAYKAPIDAAADAGRRQTLPRKCRASSPDLGRNRNLFPLERLPSGRVETGLEARS